jgi:hypothetical protein
MTGNGESVTVTGGALLGRAGPAAGVLAAALLVLHLTNPHVGAWYGRYETAHYVNSVAPPLGGGLTVAMATGDSAPAAVGIDPHYGYRLLPALLVRALPVPPPLGFVLLDYACLFGAAWLLYRILVAERIWSLLALLCALLFLSFPVSTHPPLLVWLTGSLAASVAGRVDLERCMLYHALPVLYVLARVVQGEWAFYGRWPVGCHGVWTRG